MKSKKTVLIFAILLSILITATILGIFLSSCNTEDDTPEATPAPAPIAQTPEAPTVSTPAEQDEFDDFEEPEREPTADELEFLNYDGPEMIMYHIFPHTFRELIETTNRDLMLEVEQVVHYRPSEHEDMLLRFMLIHEPAETLIFRDEAIAYGILGLTIDLELFKTFSSTVGIEHILRENGINNSVTDYIFFSHELYVEQGVPPTVMVYTENGVYFISIERTDGVLLYHVYTHSEYFEKYRMHDGELIVDGRTIPLPAETLTFENMQMLAPLRVILEAIGCDIRIESDEDHFDEIFRYGGDNLNIAMFFSKHGRDFALEIQRWAPGIIDFATGYYLNYVFPQDHLHFIHGRYDTKEDFEFYVDEIVLRYILELVDATVEVDYENRIVTVLSS